ncbi:MAG: hydrogenase expression/formation protein HypE [Thermoprotei archaeon]|nr:MAG: hydrogenase expression/formation protein HypE [Thermoprotei archaeon]
MRERKVMLAHGAGGKEMGELLADLFFSRVAENLKKVSGGVGIDFPDDAATIPLPTGEYLVVSIDSYTVNPIYFPGGNIGKLAACGSINDVLMMGGKPLAMLDAIVVEEGFPLDELDLLVNSFLEVLKEENVPLIGGDFKVMPKGTIDKVVISTVGLGIAKRPIIDVNVREGDKIIVSGSLGEHGATILALQQGMDVKSKGLQSDVRTLTPVMIPLIERCGEYLHAARDPTRGGLAMVLNDWAKDSGTIIVVEEEKIPLKPEVKAYAGMLGIDPLYLASEGVAVLAVESSMAEEVLEFLLERGCENASIIGEVRRSEKYEGLVLYRSAVGGVRILEAPTGELVPRIC